MPFSYQRLFHIPYLYTVITFYNPDCTLHDKFLPEEESRHAIKSLRIRKGEAFDIIDGKGLILHCVASDPGKKLAFDLLSHEIKTRSKPSLHVALSPLKQTDRFETFLEKATELGVHEISPVLCKRTEKARIKAARLDRIIIAAMKQSGNAFKPILNPPIALEDLLSKAKEKERFIGHCEKGNKKPLKDILPKEDTLFLIGPEGDFTPEEIRISEKHGFQAIDLGNLTLRAETAAFAVSSYFQLLK